MYIRRAGKEDVELIVKHFWIPLVQEMSEIESYHELAEDAEVKAIAKKKKALQDEDTVFLIAEIDGDEVGYLKFSIQEVSDVFTRETALHISELYVKKESREQGVASELIQWAEEYGVERNIDSIELIVDEANKKALDLYSKRGYSSFRKFMKKELS